MKSKIQIFLFLACIVLSKAGYAQSSFIQNFIVEHKSNKSFLRWTITQGRTCDGIVISRSLDGVNFQSIHEIYGVCGSEDSAQTFLFTDENPELKKTNFYRLEFGSVGESAVSSVFVLPEGELVVYPNPSSSNVNFQFQNARAVEASLYVYDMQGRVAHVGHTRAGLYQLNVGSLAAGLYIYNLHLSGQTSVGKFCIIH